MDKAYRAGTCVEKGFTLLEVMIALAVFSVIAIALTKTTMTMIRLTGQIEEKTMAHWVARNQLNEMRIAAHAPNNYPVPGRRTKKVMMAEREWDLSVLVSATENQDIRRIEISVSDAEGDQPLASITGFMGAH